MQLAEPLLTVVGYMAITELGRISSFIRRVTDDFVAAESEEEEEEGAQQNIQPSNVSDITYPHGIVSEL